MKKPFALLLGLLLLAAAFATPAFAGQIVIKIGHTLPEDGAIHQGHLKFKELLEARSNGLFSVEVYSSGQLGGSDRELLDATQMNNITMCSVAGTNVASFAKEFSINDMFFAYDSPMMARAVFDGPAGQLMLESMERIGIKGFVGMEDGFRNLTNNRRKVVTVEDLRGIKMRVAENPVQIAAWKALGASPTPMSWGELFTALQQGTLDGQECTISSIDIMHFYEVQKYLSLTYHNYTSHFSMFSKEFFDSLTPEQQTMVVDCHTEARAYQRDLLTKMESNLVEKLRNLGTIEITELTPEQLSDFRAQCQEINDTLVKERSGPELYNLFQTEIANYRKNNQ